MPRRPNSPRSRRSPALLAVSLGAPLLLIAALAAPLLFADTTFNPDWLNHLWYMWHQSLAIRANGVPSLYLNYSRGVFYPLYAFYGGTLYSATLRWIPTSSHICSASSPPTEAGTGYRASSG